MSKKYAGDSCNYCVFSYLRNKSVWTVVAFLELTNFSGLYYRQIVKR